MNLKKYWFLLYVVSLGAVGQELPPIQNFFPKDYLGENQNWSIAQSLNKLIYVANSAGLLEYNGASWKLHPSPNETIMRSVTVVDEKIYTGCYREFGFWLKNEVGILKYTSLSSTVEDQLLEDEEFWNIVSLNEFVIFQSLKRIYIYNTADDSIVTIDSETTITKIFLFDNTIYFHRSGRGIFKIEAGTDVLVFDDPAVKNDEVIQLFGNKNQPIVLTKHNGFFKKEEDSLVPDITFPNNTLKGLSLYDGIQLNDGSYLLGSISEGLFHINRSGDQTVKINQNNGLANNTVLSLFQDIDNAIWLGLDHGISHLNMQSPYAVFEDFNGQLGSVYASIIHEDNLYLGTNQGLFYKPNATNDNFSFVEGTQGQVWDFQLIDDTLFCGHHTGTFLINDAKATKVANVPGTWKIEKIESKDDLLLQGNYDGLYVLQKSNDTWKVRNKIDGFDNSSRYFEILGNNIFVNHEYNGVFKLSIDDNFTEVTAVEKDTLIKGANSGLAMYRGDLLYAFKKGVYKFDKKENRFLKDSLLSVLYDEKDYESGKLIVDKRGERLWVFTKSGISYLENVGLVNKLSVKTIPLTKEVRNGILGYENILKIDEDEDQYLIGKTSGYIIVNEDNLLSEKFNVYFSSLENNGKGKGENRILDGNIQGDFESSHNSFQFSFYIPQYSKFHVNQYQHRLNGRDIEWSEWSSNATVVYENLPSGDYTFELRGRSGSTPSTNVASYSFAIARPWYLSNFMIALYVLGTIAFSFFMHVNYRRYYKRQQRKLIEKNEQRLKLTRVENEKEIIKIKKEQLEKEYKSKSKELAASTMSIVKKNELLTKIKEDLTQLDMDAQDVKPIINTIDKSLSKNDDWEFFKEAFNNADRKFLKKLKKLHPNLSPNDIKLCAYLRLNLSSKEIAPLLNISIRSVEIKRYRLRKKMRLQHEENLVNYILGL
ncbi:triple tyrosine motif-containing protein [Spongiivirga sp. MCCC 1A20706]|uniref:helix-turn-helix and ligand-binding sensor domain-containing protein n=1 Tax=Spongiivirga sp. MCCC 1A20706 TaxID=3160963 RepID=UPI003977D283